VPCRTHAPSMAHSITRGKGGKRSVVRRRSAELQERGASRFRIEPGSPICNRQATARARHRAGRAQGCAGASAGSKPAIQQSATLRYTPSASVAYGKNASAERELRSCAVASPLPFGRGEGWGEGNLLMCAS
jgi:hypothetical protein